MFLPMASLTEITGNLGTNRAAHLLRRVTFGPTIAQINQFAGYTATEAMNELFKEPAQNPSPPIDPLTAATWVDPRGQVKAGESNSEQAAVGIFIFCAGQVFIEVVGLGFQYVGKVHSPSKTHSEVFRERIDLGFAQDGKNEEDKRKYQDFSHIPASIGYSSAFNIYVINQVNVVLCNKNYFQKRMILNKLINSCLSGNY